jgi:hypothetical protein
MNKCVIVCIFRLKMIIFTQIMKTNQFYLGTSTVFSSFPKFLFFFLSPFLLGRLVCSLSITNRASSSSCCLKGKRLGRYSYLTLPDLLTPFSFNFFAYFFNLLLCCFTFFSILYFTLKLCLFDGLPLARLVNLAIIVINYISTIKYH